MSYTNVIKSIPLHRLTAFIERRLDKITGLPTEVEHFIWATKSGAVVDIQPQRKIARLIHANSYSSASGDNYYPTILYGWKGNKILVQDGEPNRLTPNFTLYDPDTGEMSFIEMDNKLGRYDLGSSSSGVTQVHRALISSDGHIFGTNFRNNAAPSSWFFNTDTCEMEWCNKDSLPIYTHIHTLTNSVVMKIDNGGGPFDGMYHSKWWDDSGNAIFEIFRQEALDNGVVVKGTHQFFIHDSDREVSSTKRRAIACYSILGGATYWYVMDVKDPSVWYRSNAATSLDSRIYNLPGDSWVDETLSAVSTASWTEGTLNNEPYKSGTTVTKPTYSSSIFYSNARKVGRFGFSLGYVANKTYNFALPIALEDENGYVKGQIIIPSNWTTINYATSFYNNGSSVSVYICNFGGTLGFSDQDEYVGFIVKPGTSSLGYISPVDYTFVIYDPTAPGNQIGSGGYIVSGPVDMDEGEFGCYYDDITTMGSGSIVEIEGDSYYYDTVFSRMNSVLGVDTILQLDQTQDVGNVSFVVMKDTSKPWQKDVIGVSRVPSTNGILNTVTEMIEDRIMFSGINYSGVIAKDRDPGDGSLDHLYAWGDVISFKGSIKIDDNRIVYYGYLSNLDLFDISDDANLGLAQTKISTSGLPPETSYACVYDTDVILISGNHVRSASYKGKYGGIGYVDLVSETAYILPGQPNYFKHGLGETVRVAMGLKDSTYSDAAAEAIFAAYITDQAITRAAGIALLEDTPVYSTQGAEAYGGGSGKFVIQLDWDGYAGLYGIRINTQADGLGTWHTFNYPPGVKAGTADTDEYAAALFINKADLDLSTLTSGDYKLVYFTDLVNKVRAGRVAISDNYIAFMDHDHPNADALIRIISKTNFEAAAVGAGTTTFDTTVTIDLLSTSTTGYGFGAHGGSYSFFNRNGTPRNSYFTYGDYLFVTISINGSSPYAAIVRVDLDAGTYSVWCTDTVKSDAKGLTYNATTDTAFYTRGLVTFRIANFTTLTPPYAVV